MTNDVKAFGNFSLFYSATFLLFWPFALVAIGSALGFALFLTWQGDFIPNALLLWEGAIAPAPDMSLVFLVPAVILFGLPIWFLTGGGSLGENHQNILTILNESITTPFGVLGLALTAIIALAFIGWSLWCVKKTLEISWEKSSIYLALLAIIISGFILLI